MVQINVKVNGRSVSRQVEDRTLLVEFVRETFRAHLVPVLAGRAVMGAR
jgi:hypothetical protein